MSVKLALQGIKIKMVSLWLEKMDRVAKVIDKVCQNLLFCLPPNIAALKHAVSDPSDDVDFPKIIGQSPWKHCPRRYAAVFCKMPEFYCRSADSFLVFTFLEIFQFLWQTSMNAKRKSSIVFHTQTTESVQIHSALILVLAKPVSVEMELC